MARILGVDIPSEKRVEVSLSYIYGIGSTGAKKILKVARVDPNIRVKDLKEEELSRIREGIEKNYTIEGSLKHQITLNIKRLKETQSYRGIRHIRNLPLRGQRTRTNARTRKGRRSVIGTSRKAA